MQSHAHTADLSSVATKHNIASVYYNLRVTTLPRRSSEPRIQTGLCALWGGIGSLPSGISPSFLSGRGGAYCMSIPAAKSSARVSISSSSNSINFFRKLAMRLSRVSLNSAIRPWWTAVRYSTIRRSRSSAVAGFRMASLPVSAPSARLVDMICEQMTFFNCNWLHTAGTTA
jgi:hypothetical protein